MNIDAIVTKRPILFVTYQGESVPKTIQKLEVQLQPDTYQRVLREKSQTSGDVI